MARSQQPFLNMAVTRPSKKARVGASLTVAALVVFALIVAPIARDPLPQVAAFQPMYATAVFMSDAFTAYLLAIQFANSRQLAVGLLAAAYSFTAPLALLQLLVFPGVFSPEGLFHAGPQAAVRFWALWHAAFPTIVLAAALVDARGVRILRPRSFSYMRFATVFGPPLAAIASGAALIQFGNRLRPLISEGQYEAILRNPVGIYLVVVSVAAFFAVSFLGRWRNLLNVWLSIVVLCALLDVVLVLSGGARYTVGWYGARLLSIGTGVLLLGVTLWEINKLYARLSYSNRRLTDLASHDGLTGLRNRRYFDSAILELCKSPPLALFLIDVDLFKRYNDSFGHQRGDEVLKRVAEAIEGVSRDGPDVVARYGGEEFAIIMPDIDEVGARAIGERLRAAVAALNIPAPESVGANAVLSISVGIALAEKDTEVTAEALVRSADEALYAAKHTGRNRARLRRVGKYSRYDDEIGTAPQSPAVTP